MTDCPRAGPGSGRAITEEIGRQHQPHDPAGRVGKDRVGGERALAARRGRGRGAVRARRRDRVSPAGRGWRQSRSNSPAGSGSSRSPTCRCESTAPRPRSRSTGRSKSRYQSLRGSIAPPLAAICSVKRSGTVDRQRRRLGGDLRREAGRPGVAVMIAAIGEQAPPRAGRRLVALAFEPPGDIDRVGAGLHPDPLLDDRRRRTRSAIPGSCRRGGSFRAPDSPAGSIAPLAQRLVNSGWRRRRRPDRRASALASTRTRPSGGSTGATSSP